MQADAEPARRGGAQVAHWTPADFHDALIR